MACCKSSRNSFRSNASNGTSRQSLITLGANPPSSSGGDSSTDSNLSTRACRSCARASLMAMETSQVLSCVFGVLLVLQDGEGGEVHALLVRPHQFVEELALAAEDARDQFGIANCR